MLKPPLCSGHCASPCEGEGAVLVGFIVPSCVLDAGLTIISVNHCTCTAARDDGPGAACKVGPTGATSDATDAAGAADAADAADAAVAADTDTSSSAALLYAATRSLDRLAGRRRS